MTKARRSPLPAWVSAAALLALWSTTVPAAAPVGEVTHLSGLLTVKSADGSSRVLAVRSGVQEGDLLSTERETYARVKFRDGGEMVLRPATQVKVDAYSFTDAKPEKDNVLFSLLKGGLRAVTGLIGKRNRDQVQFRSPTATIGIRGTHFGMLFCNDDCSNIPTTTGAPPANGLHLDVAAGAVAVSNAAGQTVVGTGQFGYVANPQTVPVIVPPEQGIQVTMPPNISANRAGGRSVGGGQLECAP